MNNNRWKDKYYDYNGNPVNLTSTFTKYVSNIGTSDKADGTRLNPYLGKDHNFEGGAYPGTNYWILSGGNISGFASGAQSSGLQLIGQGMLNTSLTIGPRKSEYQGGKFRTIYIRDCSIESIYSDPDLSGISLKKCRILSTIVRINSEPRITIANSLVKASQNYSYNITVIKSSFAGITIEQSNSHFGSECLYEKCNLALYQNDINTFRNNYLGFDSCRFRLGNEQEYTELTGNTEQELRDNFVARCTAQNISVPDITESGETLKLGRWVFSKNSTIEGQVVKDSIIDRFQKRRAIKLGYSDNVIENIPISVEKTSAHSISVDNVDNNLVIENGSIHFDSETSITEKKECVVDSKIIWLGGKQRISSIDIMNNLPMNYGVMIDNTISLSDNPVLSTAIESNKNYLIRSANNDRATITYNGKTYTSSLSEKNNIFRGIDGQESFADISGNAQVFEALDYAVQQTIQMRIVDNLPAQKITSGSLQTGYWYYIAPDDLSDASGTIEYNGDNYPCYSSFIATDTSSIAVNGACHLRRCWHKDFDFDSEATDKAFWQEIQKPKWIDIVPNDLRCLKKNNSEYTIEMAMDSNGEYITSGHPDFYSLITGESGIPTPSFNITGSFMQLRLVISTLNPM